MSDLLWTPADVTARWRQDLLVVDIRDQHKHQNASESGTAPEGNLKDKSTLAVSNTSNTSKLCAVEAEKDLDVQVECDRLMAVAGRNEANSW